MASQSEEDLDLSSLNSYSFMENRATHPTDVGNNSLFELDPLSKRYQSIDDSRSVCSEITENSPVNNASRSRNDADHSTAISQTAGDSSVYPTCQSSLQLMAVTPAGRGAGTSSTCEALSNMSLNEAESSAGQGRTSIMKKNGGCTSGNATVQDLEVSSSSAGDQNCHASAKTPLLTDNASMSDGSPKLHAKMSSDVCTTVASETDHLFMEDDPKIDATKDGMNNYVMASDFDEIVPCLNKRQESVVQTRRESQSDVLVMLKAELDDKHSKLDIATKTEQALLQSNTELQEEFNAMIREMTDKIEMLEQERYILQNKLDLKMHMEDHMNEEMEKLKLELKCQKDSRSNIEEEHTKTITKLRNELTSQQMALEQSQLCCRQLENRCTELEKMLQDARNQINHKVVDLNQTSSEEMSQLHSEINTLQNEKISLLHELNETQCSAERFQHSLKKTEELLQLKERELEEKLCQITSYHNMLEKAREEIQELKVLADIAKMESQNRNSKGNSLFSEVEDRRVKAEKELISLKVKYESLKKELKVIKQHEFRLKTQLVLQLQKTPNTAELRCIDRLQNELSYAQTEIASLLKQVYEREKATLQEQDFRVMMYDKFNKDSNATYEERFNMFQDLIKKKDKTFEDLQAKLKAMHLQKLIERQRVLKQQREIYDKELELEAKDNLILRLKLKLAECQLKTDAGGLLSEDQMRNEEGKENQQVVAKDCKNTSEAKLASGSKVEKQSLNDKSVEEYKGSVRGPLLCRKQKTKSVSISDDVTVHGGDTKDCVQSADIDSTQTESGNKGRPRGKYTYRNVSCDEPQCKQQ